MIQDIRQQIDKNQDFQWAFYLNQKFLTAYGVWSNYKEESRLQTWRLPLILLIIVCGSCLPATYALIQVQNELNLVIDNLIVTISGWISVVKLFLLWYHRSACASLMKWSKSNWSRCTEDWERELMFKQSARGRFIATFSYTAVFVHSCGFMSAPMLNLGIRIVNNITDPNPHRYLPFQSYYPYEYYKSPYYELTYLTQIIAGTLSAVAYVSVDTFFATLVFHASGQSEILTEYMSRLCEHEDHQSFGYKAQELIEYHNRLVRYVAIIEKSFTVTIFFQMFGCMLLTCSAGYACIKVIDETSSIKQIVILVAAALNVNEHILIYCLSCEILSTNSSEMFDGIYSSTWYDLPPNEARYVTLILARAQYPLRLSAGKFFYLSMNSYVQILKSTAGYISMLLTIS